MPRLSRSLLVLGTALAGIGVVTADPLPAEETLARPVIDPDFVSFVETYCIECHNDFVLEGDRSFDAFITDPDDPAHKFLVVEMLDALNHGTMPKQRPGEDIAMPSDDERRFAVGSLTGYLTALAALEDPAETPLRRLTNTEYRNTVSDMLGVHVQSSQAAMAFTADTNVHGLQNLAASQTLARQQLQSYVTAAQEYLDAAFKPVLEPMPEASRTISKPASFLRGRGTTELTRQTWLSLGKDGAYLDLGYSRVGDDRPVHPIEFRNTGVPADGVYAIRVEVEAVNRLHPYDRSVYRYNGEKEPLKLAIGYAPSPEKLDVVSAPERPTLGVFDVPDNKRQVFEVQTLLQKGSVPVINWANGPGNGTAYIAFVVADQEPSLAKYISEGNKSAFNIRRNNFPPDLAKWLRDDFQGSRLRVYSMEVIGPFDNMVAGAFTTADFKRFAETPRGKLDEVFVEFASKAFRRPVTKAEVAPYLALANARLKQGGSQINALKLGFAAVMSSPRFLFLDEGNSEEGRALDNYELASRLSYFLWSSLPDQELLDLAAAGKLTDPAVLNAQVKRMIGNRRASAFVSGFTSAWLRLDKLGSMPPDQRVHGSYFRDRLETAMRKETETVFAEVLFANRDPKVFLDSDFTYVNGGLAQLYNIDGVDGEAFERVSLPEDSPRRGLIGHASILTASANGIDTSPVIRGVWILENLIGTPPPAPPPDVPAIEPDARGATTIRDLLEKHRSVQACKDCHMNIDPYGFPLEVFGPIGEFRNKYPAEVNGQVRLNRGAPVEKDTVLPSGKAVNNLKQYRAHLLSRESDFKRHLVEKMLAYGTGREPTFRDRAEIERILLELENEQGGFQDMLVKVATSEYFVSR